MVRRSLGDRTFNFFNYTFMIMLAVICILPFIHVAALSFSSGEAATAGRVGLLPVEFSLNSYEYAFQKPEFLNAFKNSLLRVALGVSINMVLVTLCAYPLSKTNKVFPGRTFFSWFFVVTMLVGGGLIPTYLVVSATGLRNTIWSLVLPGAVNAFNVTILLNFFRQIPKELEESAFLDGAGQWRILFNVYLPLSGPALATLTLFTTVGHWNEWFNALIYMNSPKQYPLQSYLQNIIVNPNFDMLDMDQMELMMTITSRTFKAAQIMIATIPILCAYPFLQKYFVKGMTLGSLKG